jgi:hypothetical protein
MDEFEIVETLVNELAEIVVIIDGFLITTVINAVQLSNALDPIVVTESGIVTDVSLEQYRNTLSPIVVTELGMLTDIRPVQIPNA